MLKLWTPGNPSAGGMPEAPREQVGPGIKAATEAGAFPQLPESALVHLFNSARVIRLAAGEPLFAAKSVADTCYVVLTGRVLLGDAGAALPERFGPGAWICELGFPEPLLHQSSATARTAATLLAIDAPVFAGFDDALRAYLLKRIEQSVELRLQKVKQLAGQLQERNQLLGEALYQARVRKATGFGKTPAALQLFAKVPALPVSTISLLNKMLDDRTTKNEIVELVSMDPALTSTLLKAANSPYYGFLYKVTNVSHAVVLLGHNSVYQIIMSESMRRSLPNTPLFNEIHRRALEVSRLAFVVSQTLRLAKPAEVATLGILSEIGLVVTQLLKTYNARLSMVFDALEPAELGAALLRSWNLPDSICDSLEYQHYPEFAAPERIPAALLPTVTVLYLAKRCHDLLHAVAQPVPGFLVPDYLAAVGHADTSEHELLYRGLVPRLRAQLRQLPRSLAERLGPAGADTDAGDAGEAGG